MRSKERDIAAAAAAGEIVEPHEVARRVLHKLISCTNRRMHKGFPEMITYLLMKPMEYTSHDFVNVNIDILIRRSLAIVHGFMDGSSEHDHNLDLCRLRQLGNHR